jgi:hypothetical protein
MICRILPPNGNGTAGRELRAHEAVAEVVERLLRQRVARQPELQDRHRRRVVGDDVRRQRAGRQDAQDRCRIRRGLGDRAIDVGARVKEDLDDRDAVQRLRFDVLDVLDIGCERAFIVRGDALRHVLCGESVVGPDDAHHRNVDVRKDIRRRSHDRERADQEQQEREDNEGIGPAKGQSDDPHKSSRALMRLKRKGMQKPSVRERALPVSDARMTSL